MLRGVVFDMDGVVINSHPAHRQAWQEFLQMYGKQVPDSDLDFILEGRKRQDILRHFLGDLPETQLREYGEKKDEVFQKICDEVLPVAGVVALLQELQQLGIPAAMATSASARRTRLTLNRLNLTQYFRAIVTGDEVAEGKPNPAIYELATRRLRLPAETLLALEDAPGGVVAALCAGMRCIGIASQSKANALRLAGAEHVIGDFVGVSVNFLQNLSNGRDDGARPAQNLSSPP
jgi:beta-phosphoglucomutase